MSERIQKTLGDMTAQWQKWGEEYQELSAETDVEQGPDATQVVALSNQREALVEQLNQIDQQIESAQNGGPLARQQRLYDLQGLMIGMKGATDAMQAYLASNARPGSEVIEPAPVIPAVENLAAPAPANPALPTA